MKNISDQIAELMELMIRLEKKMDKIIDKNSPPEDVVELFNKIRRENDCGMVQND